MKVLVIAPNWLGDLIIANALLKILKKLQYTVHVVATAHLALLQRMPEVDKVIQSPLQHNKLPLVQILKLAAKLKQEHYDLAIIVPNSFKSALLPFLSGIATRRGFKGEQRYIVLNQHVVLDLDTMPRIVDRYCALGKDAAQENFLPVPTLQVDHNNVQKLIQKYNIQTSTKIIALAPGTARGDAKCWPYEYYAEVAQYALQQGWQVFILGAPHDKTIAAKINQVNAGQCIDLCGKTSILDAVDLLSLAEVVLSNDSGIMHMAASLHQEAKPPYVIAFYGPTPSSFAPPLTEFATIFENQQIACRPCHASHCVFGHKQCLTTIKPAKIISLLATRMLLKNNI